MEISQVEYRETDAHRDDSRSGRVKEISSKWLKLINKTSCLFSSFIWFICFSCVKELWCHQTLSVFTFRSNMNGTRYRCEVIKRWRFIWTHWSSIIGFFPTVYMNTTDIYQFMDLMWMLVHWTVQRELCNVQTDEEEY